MKYQIFLVSLVFLSLILVFNVPNSFGHGLGTETMPSVMIDGTKATLQVASNTNLDTGSRQITISLFETSSSNAINNVSFIVDLIKNDERLFINNFERDNGVLIMNLIPSKDSDVQIVNEGSLASFFGLESDEFNLKGNVFENGGLYKFNVKILTINNYNNVLSQQVNYDLGISIPETTYYEIDDENFGSQRLGIVTYFDQITKFNYNQITKEIEFSFPFDWEQNTIDQTSIIHEEILIPRSFGDLLVSSFNVSLNDIQLPESAINIDDFSAEERIVHVIVNQDVLQEVFSKNQFNTNEVIIKIKPSDENLPLMGITKNGQFKVILSWEDEIKSNSNVKLNYDILDTFLKDKPISVPYELKIFYNDNKVLNKNAMSTGSKTETNSFEFYVSTDISGILIVKFENLGENQLANLEFPLIVDRKIDVKQEYFIPEWVKNNAKWWSAEEIDDKTFANGIEYLIKQGIIVVPVTSSEGEESQITIIPDWVKVNAVWWGNNQIDDKTFANGIEYLIKVGIIVV